MRRQYHYFGLRYKNSTHFADKPGNLAGLDQSSGSYPFEIYPDNQARYAHFFYTYTEAENYVRMFPELEVVRLTIVEEDV